MSARLPVQTDYSGIVDMIGQTLCQKQDALESMHAEYRDQFPTLTEQFDTYKDRYTPLFEEAVQYSQDHNTLEARKDTAFLHLLYHAATQTSLLAVIPDKVMTGYYAGINQVISYLFDRYDFGGAEELATRMDGARIEAMSLLGYTDEFTAQIEARAAELRAQQEAAQPDLDEFLAFMNGMLGGDGEGPSVSFFSMDEDPDDPARNSHLN